MNLTSITEWGRFFKYTSPWGALFNLLTAKQACDYGEYYRVGLELLAGYLCLKHPEAHMACTINGCLLMYDLLRDNYTGLWLRQKVVSLLKRVGIL